ncbi:response regulator [Zobellia barbeyronii]|uniref:Response regulator n=1 Tax=Zobellia barbeyronii TaxID=2748009 RepID=A0ABS5WGX2_9FLAO|nr:response regulator [Zobellia barbeyronii]MBT2161452.1 response regulator [Zobellia barbeyronii]
MNTGPLIYIDDDEDDRMLFQEAMEELFPMLPVESYENGPSFLKRLTGDIFILPKIIFLDLNMPVVSGAECLTRIRKNTHFTEIPVIMYSTTSNPKDQLRCLDLGANMFVTKSRSYNAMKKQLTEIINTHLF